MCIKISRLHSPPDVSAPTGILHSLLPMDPHILNATCYMLHRCFCTWLLAPWIWACCETVCHGRSVWYPKMLTSRRPRKNRVKTCPPQGLRPAGSSGSPSFPSLPRVNPCCAQLLRLPYLTITSSQITNSKDSTVKGQTNVSLSFEKALHQVKLRTTFKSTEIPF